MLRRFVSGVAHARALAAEWGQFIMGLTFLSRSPWPWHAMAQGDATRAPLLGLLLPGTRFADRVDEVAAWGRCMGSLA